MADSTFIKTLLSAFNGGWWRGFPRPTSARNAAKALDAAIEERLLTVGDQPLAPDDIPNLLGWWKADSISQSDGTTVASWTDSSGGGNTMTQGTEADKPLFRTNIQNGLPALSFDESGSGDFLGLSAQKTNIMTAVLVAKWSGANDRDYVPFIGNSPGGGTLSFHGEPFSGGNWFGGSGSSILVYDGQGWKNNLYWGRNHTNLLRGADAAAQIWVVRTLGACSGQSTPQQNTFGTRTWRGYIFEYIWYSRPLGDPEIEGLIAHLRDRWAI